MIEEAVKRVQLAQKCEEFSKELYKATIDSIIWPSEQEEFIALKSLVLNLETKLKAGWQNAGEIQ